MEVVGLAAATPVADGNDDGSRAQWASVQKFVDSLYQSLDVGTPSDDDVSGMDFSSALQLLLSLTTETRRTIGEDGHAQGHLSQAVYVSALSSAIGRFVASKESGKCVVALNETLCSSVVDTLADALSIQDMSWGAVSPSPLLSRHVVFDVACGFNIEQLGLYGFEGRQPIIYGTEEQDGRVLTSSLKLPASSFRLIPVVRSSSKHIAISVSDLEAMIRDDVTNGKRPLIVIASVGSGRSDDLNSIGEVCQEHNVWLHVEGEDAAVLLLQAVNEYHAISSITLDTSYLFDRSDGVVTFFRRPSQHPPSSHTEPLAVLPLWVQLHLLGGRQFGSSIKDAVLATENLVSQINQRPSLEIIGAHDKFRSLSVLIRYAPVLEDGESQFSEEFLDKLCNQILLDIIEEARGLGVDMVALNGRAYLRFRPLLCNLHDSSLLSLVAQKILTETKCIDDTIKGRPTFAQAVSHEKEMQVVAISDFIGLGAVRFFPSFLPKDNLSPAMKKEVDNLNSRLATTLREKDPIFREGVTLTGDVCVGVGVDTEPLTESRVIAYMDQIRDTAKSLNLYHKMMEDMEEIVRNSIRDAEQQLLQERSQRANQGFWGINVWGWWGSEGAPSQPLNGRTFDLARHSAPTASVQAVKIVPKTSTERPSLDVAPSTPTTAANASVAEKKGEKDPKPVEEPQETISTQQENELEEKESTDDGDVNGDDAAVGVNDEDQQQDDVAHHVDEDRVSVEHNGHDGDDVHVVNAPKEFAIEKLTLENGEEVEVEVLRLSGDDLL